MANSDYYINQRIIAHIKAENGNALAQFHMYSYFNNGEGGLKASAKDAKYWLNLALEQQLYAAIIEFANLYSKGKYARSIHEPGIFGRSLKKDLSKALFYFEKAVNMGDLASLRAIYKILSDKSYESNNDKLAITYMEIMAKKSWKNLKKVGFSGKIDTDLHRYNIDSFCEEARHDLLLAKPYKPNELQSLSYIDGSESPEAITRLESLLIAGNNISWIFKTIVDEIEKLLAASIYDYDYDYLKAVQILECWRDEFTKTAHTFELEDSHSNYEKISDRKGSFLFGHPLVNNFHPWPVNKKGEGLTPLLQIDFIDIYKKVGIYCEDNKLKNWLSKQTKDSKTRYLQVWIDSFFHEEGSQIRLLPDISPNKSPDSLPKSFSSSNEEVGDGISMFRFNIVDIEISTAKFYCSNYFEEGLTFNLVHRKILNEQALRTYKRKINKLEKQFEQLPSIDYQFLVGDRSFFFGTYSHSNGSLMYADDLYLGGGWKSFMQISSGPYDSDFSGWSYAKPAIMYRFPKGTKQPEFKLIFG